MSDDLISFKERSPYDRVINVGLNKTGTTSLREAFSMLGFKRAFNRTSRDFHKGKKLYANGDIDALLSLASQCDNMGDHPFPWIVDEIRKDKRFDNALLFASKRQTFDAWFESLHFHGKKKGFRNSAIIWYGLYPRRQNSKVFHDIFHDHYEKTEELGVPIIDIESTSFRTILDLLIIDIDQREIDRLGLFPHRRKRSK